MKPDHFTPFFVPWRARLSSARRALPRSDSSQPILHQLEALFSWWLLCHWLSPREEGAFFRHRYFPLRLNLWSFLAQLPCPCITLISAVPDGKGQAWSE